MDPMEQKLEQQLQQLPLRQPSPALDERMAELFTPAANNETQPEAVEKRPLSGRLLLVLLPLAAAACLGWFAWLNLQQENQPQSPNAMPGDPVVIHDPAASEPQVDEIAQAVEPALPAVADAGNSAAVSALQVESINLRLVADGVTVDPKRGPLRRYRPVGMEQHWEIDPVSQSRVLVSQAYEQTVYVPVVAY